MVNKFTNLLKRETVYRQQIHLYLIKSKDLSKLRSKDEIHPITLKFSEIIISFLLLNLNTLLKNNNQEMATTNTNHLNDDIIKRNINHDL